MSEENELPKPVVECEIDQYIHCRNCIIVNKRPDKIAAGWTKQGLQIWCEVCETNIIHMDFEQKKIKVITIEKL